MSQEDDPGVTHRDEHPVDGPTIPREKGMESAFPRYRKRGSEFAPGTIIADRFRIVNRVGAGGMGEVYRAEDLKLGQTVALKFVSPGTAHHDQVVAMLYREVRLGRGVSHPNVARLYDVFEWQSTHFVAMEFIDGEDLAGLLRRIGRLPHDKGVEIAREITRGLAAAHSRGVLHRDLKPANVMIDGRGEAKITDFGLAVGGDEDVRGSAGTPAYMAPEQFTGTPASIQSDLYALGLVMYEIFTGKRVRRGSTAAELLSEHAEPPSAPSTLQPDIDPWIEKVILHCLAADPSKRPRSAHEVLSALPGGDRLAAAIAAGETPSPDAVVAADVEGTVSKQKAAVFVAAIVVLMSTIILLKHQLSPPALVDWTRPPAVLNDRALGIVGLLGAPPPAFTHQAVEMHPELVHWIAQNDPSPDRWQTLDRLPVYTFNWYGLTRPVMPEDPGSLIQQGTEATVEIELDLRGDLRSLLVREGAEGASVGDLAALTGLDGLVPAEPSLLPPVHVDQQLAWQGQRRGVAVEERLEVGLRAGAPVWLAVTGPWTPSDQSAEFEMPFANRSLRVFMVIVGALTFLIAGFLAWRNLRSGRGDRSGAIRIALAVTVLEAGGAIVGAAYPPWLIDRALIVRNAASEAIYSGAVLFVVYLALEPLIRRLWPQLLISWRRLLSGRWRDPLVGRDVMIGIMGGLAHSILASSTWRVTTLFGGSPESPGSGWLQTLLSPRGAIEAFGSSAGNAVFAALGMIFLLALFVTVTGRRWGGVVLMLVVLNVGFFFAVGELRVLPVLISLLTVGLAARFGLLTLVLMYLSFYMTFHYPLLVDTSQWFFWTSAFPVFLIGVLTYLACRSALGISPVGSRR